MRPGSDVGWIWDDDLDNLDYTDANLRSLTFRQAGGFLTDNINYPSTAMST